MMVKTSKTFQPPQTTGRGLQQAMFPGLLLALGLSTAVTSSVAAQTAPALTDNLRYAIDLSSRASYFDRRDTLGFQHALGLDLHKVFSDGHGDIGTLLLQTYVTRIDNLPMRPGFFDDAHDTELVYRMVNFNYTALDRHVFGQDRGKKFGLPNIRVGHFEIPYGLEHTINTNGTLRDFFSGRNLGLKADWGVTLNDEVGNLEYELSWSSGGGQELESEMGSYAYAGRIGSLRDNDISVGVSVYSAELKGVKRERVGVDLQWYRGLHGLLVELSLGEDGDRDVLNAQFEWNWRNRSESIFSYLRALRFSQSTDAGWQDNDIGMIGAEYRPDNHWSFSGQLSHDFTGFAGKIKETRLDLQLRYRF